MATLTERLQYILTVDPKGAVSGLQQVGKTAESELGKTEQRLDKVGSTLTKVGAGAVAFAGVAGAALYKVGTAAGDQNAAVAAMEQSFGDASKTIMAWAQNSVKAVGLSKTAAIDATTSFAGVARQMGLAGEEAAQFSIRQVQLAADMAAFKNVSPEQALQDLVSAYSGSTEVMQKYQVSLNDQVLKQTLFNETGEKVVGTLTTQQKAMAIQIALTEQTATMQGQWNREIDSNESKQAMFKARLDDLAASIGQGVVPVMSTMLDGLNTAVAAFESLPEPMKKMIGQTAAVGAGVIGLAGSLSLVVGQAIKMRDVLGKLSPTVGGITAVIGLAAVTYAAYAADKDKAKRETQEFVSALQQEPDAQREAIAAIIARRIAESDLLATAKELGLTTAQVGQIIRGETVPAYEAFKAVVDENGASADDLKFALQDMGIELSQGSANRFVAELEQMQAQLDLAGKSVEQQKQLTAELTGVNAEAAGSFQVYAGSVKTTTDAQDDLTDAQKEANEKAKTLAGTVGKTLTDAYEDAQQAVEDYYDAQRSATDSKYAAEAATDDLAESILGYSQAIIDAEGDTIKINRVNRDAIDTATKYADAQVRLAEDTATANGQTLTATDKQKIFLQSMQDSTAFMSGEQKQVIAEYIADLMGIPVSKVTEILANADIFSLTNVSSALDHTARDRDMTVTAAVDTQTADQKIAAWLNIKRSMKVGLTPESPTPRATGGTVQHGETTLTGERGPELAVFPPGTQIIPNGETERILNGHGATNFHTTINIAGDADEAKIRRALAAWEQQVAQRAQAGVR